MIDWKRWLPGLPDDEEEDAVSKTLRTLQQGASDIGTGISSAASSAGEALSSAAQTASSYLPTPSSPAPEDYSSAVIAPPEQPEPPLPTGGASLGSLASSAAAPAAGVYGRAIGDVQAEEDEVARRNREEITNPVLRAAIAPVEAVRRGVRTATAAVEATPEALTETADAALGAVGAGKETYGIDTPVGRLGIADAALALAPNRTVQAAMLGGLPVAHGRAGGTDILERGARAAGSAISGAAEGLGAALGRNAERVAGADARMAAEGGTSLPATFGALPEPGGAGRQTVEVLQERLQTATASWQRAREAGDERMAALAREHAVDLESQLVDAQNARRSLEPAITSDVGRSYESLPLAEETADTLSGAGSRRIDPDDLGGPMSVIPDMAGRANATAGTLPVTRGAGALSAVNRALGEGIAGGVGGAVIEQATAPGSAQGEDESDADYAARRARERVQRAATGFAAGAVGFPAATRLARGAARLAGAGTDVGGGARIALGDVPPSQIRRPGLPGFEEPRPAPIGEAAEDLAVPTEALAARFPDVGKALSAAQKRAADMQARGLTPPSWADWVKQFGYSGIFGPATATGQLISGAVDVGLAQPKEAIRAVVTGKGGRYSAQARAQLDAVPEAWEGLKGILAGQGGSAGAAARSGGAQGTANLSERVVNPVAHLAARALERPGEILAEAPDAVFRPLFNAQGMRREADTIAHELGHRGKQAAATAEQLMQDAKAARANPDQALVSGEARRIIDAGKAYADEMGYKGDPGGLADWIGKQSRRDDAIGVAASFLFPFSRTPGNIALATARSTPGIGLLPGVRKGRPIKSFDVIYDQAFGTLAASGLAAYATQGGITGTGPDDKAERDAMTAKGWQPRSFLVPGGYYVPNRALGKWGPILDSIGEAHDHLAYRKADAKPGAWTADAVKRIGHIATDQVGLSGLADIMDLIDSAGSGAPGFLGRAATRYTPFGGIIRSVAQATDPTARKPETWAQAGSLGEATLQQIEQSIPGLRQGVATQQTPLGEDLPNPQFGLGALIPKTTAARDNPTITAFQDAGVSIGGPPDAIKGVALTPAQQRRWMILRGRELKAARPDVLQTRGMPAAERKAEVRRILAAAGALAADEIEATFSERQLREAERKAG